MSVSEARSSHDEKFIHLGSDFLVMDPRPIDRALKSGTIREMGLFTWLFGTGTPKDPEIFNVKFAMLKNKKTQRYALKVNGRNWQSGSSRMIQEINKDGTFSKREPYWIGTHNENWGQGGYADVILTVNHDRPSTYQVVRFHWFNEFAQEFQTNQDWVVFCNSWKPNESTRYLEVAARSSEEAKTRIIESSPPHTIMVSGAMLKREFERRYLQGDPPEEEGIKHILPR